jgi:hypothetical protein
LRQGDASEHGPLATAVAGQFNSKVLRWQVEGRGIANEGLICLLIYAEMTVDM